MPEKRVVQDIVPSGKRTIRNIPPKKIPVEEEEDVEHIPIRRAPPSLSLSKSQTHFKAESPRLRRQEGEPTRASTYGKGKRRFTAVLLTFLIIFIGIAVIAAALSLLYSKAAVTITPKTAHVEINGTFTAKKNGDPTLTNGSLAYDVYSVTQTSTQNVPATEGVAITSKAKGVATLYNEQTTQQKLVAGTRFSNEDSDIYRISATVVIPAGIAGAPGKIDVAILADVAGAESNMLLGGATDLKIVAYKGTPKYDTVYGKIKTAIAGGASGTRVTVSPEVLKVAQTGLKDSLTTKLLNEVKKQVPADSVFYQNSYVVEFETPEPVSKGKDTAEISVKGTLTAAAFRQTPLLKSIAAKELDKFPAPTYNIDGLSNLKFIPVNTKDFSPRKGTPLIFNLKGSVDLVGIFSEKALKDELKGTYLKDSNSIFAHYPSIANAYALITPFWMRSFPNSPDKIIIEIKK